MKRRNRRLLIAGALGVVSTVFAAWVLGNLPTEFWWTGREPFRTAMRETKEGPRTITLRPFSPARYFFTSTPHAIDYVRLSEQSAAELERLTAEGGRVIMSGPRWIGREWRQMPWLIRSVRQPVEEPEFEWERTEESEIVGIAQGLPWPCVYALSDGGISVTPEPYEGMFSLEVSPYTYWMFPYRVHWPTFAADTAVFSAGWFVVIGVPGVVRRWRRRRGGRCESCGYDLKGSPAGGVGACPECGEVGRARRERRARAVASGDTQRGQLAPEDAGDA